MAVADRAMYLAKTAAPGQRDAGRRPTIRTCAPSTRRPWPSSTGATRRSCSRRSSPAPAPCSGRRTATSTSSSRTGAGSRSATAPAPSAGSSATTCDLDEGVGGRVVGTGAPFAIDDYDTFEQRASDVPIGILGAVVGVPLNSGDEVVGVIGLASGTSGRPFRAARDRRAVALRPARLDRARQRAARGRRPARRAVRPDDGPAEPRAADRPHRPRPGLGQPGRGGPDRRHHAGPRPVQGHQRERRPRRRRPAADGRRPAPGRQPAAGRHGRAVRWRRVRDHPRPRLGRGRGPPDRRPTRARSCARRSRSTAATGSSAPRSGSPSAGPGASTPDELLREAEIAMVRAKADPAGRQALFEPSMSEQSLERIDLENDLRRALERDELRLHYQPLVDLEDERDRRASRRWSAGSTRPAGWSRRSRSSRSPRRPASSRRWVAGSSRPPAGRPTRGARRARAGRRWSCR